MSNEKFSHKSVLEYEDYTNTENGIAEMRSEECRIK